MGWLDLAEFDSRLRLTSESTTWIALSHPRKQYFSSSETLPSNLWGFYPTQSHELGSCLVTSSSAMEALGSPSTTTIHYRLLTRYPFHCFRIFPKDFWPFVPFTFVSLFSFSFFFVYFFFASLHVMKSRKKQQHKNNNNFKQVERTHYCVEFFFFSDYHVKRA